jgi:hypothetical protein
VIISGSAAHSAAQSVVIARVSTTSQRWMQIGQNDSGSRIGFRSPVRFIDASNRVDLDLRDPISYQQFVTWGRSMMGGDTSGMLDI